MIVWICKKCATQGSFAILGRGFIRCNVCGSLHWVNPWGALWLLPPSSPGWGL